jgi:phospholipid transport system transporter-binding protein
MMQVQQAGNRWNVQGDILIGTASVLLKASQQCLMQAKTVVDFKEVGNIDTAVISLILEWKRRAKRENSTLELANMPENLKSLAALYGVTDIVN